jgi:hypothetical protein
MEYRRRSFMTDSLTDPLIEEPTETHTGTAFSYYESIQEFNQYRYGGLSYSMYHIWKHLLHLICGCGSHRTT